MNDPVRTARVIREERRAAKSAFLDRLLREHGITQALVAEQLGVGETMVAEWCKAEKARAISFADACGLPDPVRMKLAEDLAGQGFVVVRLPAPVSSSNDLRAAALAQRETSQALDHHLEALADGRITRAEGATLEREVDEAIAALLALKLRAQQAQRENVVSLSSWTDAAE